MKTETESTSTLRSKTARTRALGRAHADSPYASAAETRELLANSLGARNARLSAADMMSTDEAAELAGTTRVTIKAWIDKGRAIGLTQVKRGLRLPRWQFEPRVWDAVPKLSAALGMKEGWALLGFLESPHEALGGLTPRSAIEQGRADRVLEIAEQEGN